MKIIGNRKTAKYLVMLAPNHRKVNNKFYSKDLQEFTWNMTKAETFNITPYKMEELKKCYQKDCDLLYVPSFNEILNNEKLMQIREAYYSNKNEVTVTNINSFLDNLLTEKYKKGIFNEKTSITE